MVTLYEGDCLVEMDKIADGSIDCVIADTPYGTTACAWDSVIDLDAMWKQLKRVIKPNGAIVLFASQPYTSALVMSNPKWFKYCWIWEKSRVTGFLLAKNQPLRCHEDVLVFYKNQPIYNPQMIKAKPAFTKRTAEGIEVYGETKRASSHNEGKAYPRSVIFASSVMDTFHPTQKPLSILKYLIRTYTNEGDTVLDFTMGSGSTLVACIEENRNGIGIEMDAHYFQVANERIQKELTKPRTMKMELA